MRIPQQELKCDYTIIGAGICGLAAADNLAKRFPGARIVVFEGSAHPGGRVRSKKLDQHDGGDLSVVEFGAGRFRPRRHRRVGNLIASLDIATRPFAFDMVRNTPGASDFMPAETLLRLHRLRDTAPSAASFRTVVEAELGPIGFEVLVELSGYDTLRHPELPFLQGLEIISAHPETETIWTGEPGEWRSVSLGFEQLTERLASGLDGRATFHFNHRVERLVRSGGNVIGLEAIGPRGIVSVRCQQVVCATALHDLLALSEPAAAAVDYRAQVVDVPLVKGYIEFEQAFWPQEPRTTGQCVVSSSALRKLYLSSAQPRLFFYCDGCSAERLSDLLATESLPYRFKRDLPIILPGVDPDLAVARRWGAQHWKRGISFWAGGRQPVEAPIWSPEPCLAFLSDINTDELGWLEGALVVAGALGERIAPPERQHGGEPSPAFVQPQY